MRVALVIAALLLSGCVTELLATTTADARGLACRVFDGETKVRVIHHGDEPAIDDATAAWIVDVSRVLEEEGGRFSWLRGSDPSMPLADWAAGLDVLGRGVDLHVVWLPTLDGHAVELLAPGVVAINATDASSPVRVQGLLFHGLGHALGVVNLGIPLHDSEGPTREVPAGHTPGGPMSVAWHREDTFPDTTGGYGNGTIADWQAALSGGVVCA